MLLMLSGMLGLVQAQPLPTNSQYSDFSDVLLATVLRLKPLHAGDPMEGLTFGWPVIDDNTGLVMINDSDQVWKSDWNQSAYVGADGNAVEIIPAGIVPQNSRLAEGLFQAGAYGLEPLVSVESLGEEEGITLALIGGDQQVFYTERFKVYADLEELHLRKLTYQSIRWRRLGSAF